MLSERTKSFYADCMRALVDAEIPFMVGGAYAFAAFTGIVRHTKDLDLFLLPQDIERTIKLMQEHGYETDLTFPVWLGKIKSGNDYIDLVFRCGNGLAEVDDEWFIHARRDHLFGIPVLLCPPEESIVSKSFVMERERYDGADIMHYLYAGAESLDWPRLLRRFNEHWRVLFSYIVLFGYVYPDQRHRIPEEIQRTMLRKLTDELETRTVKKYCYGPLLSQVHYLVDIQQGGYEDARLRPSGTLQSEDIEAWQQAIQSSKEHLAQTQGISLHESHQKIPS